MDDWDFARFEFKMGFGRISYIEQNPRANFTIQTKACHFLNCYTLSQYSLSIAPLRWGVFWTNNMSSSTCRFCLKLHCPTTNHLLVLWTLRWRHNGRDSVSNHQPRDCLHNRLFRRRSKKTSKLRVTGLCAGNSPVNSPHKWPVTRKMFSFDDVIMEIRGPKQHNNGQVTNKLWVGPLLLWHWIYIKKDKSVLVFVWSLNDDLAVFVVYLPRERKEPMYHASSIPWLVSMSNINLIATFMRPTWGPSGADRTQVGPMLAPWTLISGLATVTDKKDR